MRRLPIPAHLLPAGVELTDDGTAYMDAVQLPVEGAEATLRVARTSTLYELDADDAKALAASDWRLWLRLAVTPIGVLVTLEPAGGPAPSRLPLDSDLEES